MNVMQIAFKSGVKKFLFFSSGCIYPKFTKQPVAEEELLNEKIEPTNEPYAVAKIAGMKLCDSYNRQYSSSHGSDFRCIVPAGVYGPGDNYHPKNAHVLANLIRRFH